MNTAITDAQTLIAIAPDTIVAYLQAHGWQKTGNWDDKATIWGTSSEYSTELVVPNSQQFSDYARRVAEILATLAETEQRPKSEIYDDLLSFNKLEDVLRVRAIYPEAADGTIPIKDAAKLYDGALHMVEAAAAVVHLKRPFLPSRKSSEVNAYLDQTRIGPSERGSYVLVVHSPISISFATDNTSLTKQEDRATFGRQVLITLATALEKLNTIAAKLDPEVAGETEVEKQVDDFVAHGGTAELCEAVEKLHESVHHQQVELNFAWSLVLPLPLPLTNIILDQAVAPITKSFQRTLRRRQQHEEVTLHGRIIGFRERGVADIDMPVVTIVTKVNGTNRHVRIPLQNDADRLVCIRALEQRKRIICTGRFVQIANYNILEDYHDLEIEENK